MNVKAMLLKIFIKIYNLSFTKQVKSINKIKT